MQKVGKTGKEKFKDNVLLPWVNIFQEILRTTDFPLMADGLYFFDSDHNGSKKLLRRALCFPAETNPFGG